MKTMIMWTSRGEWIWNKGSNEYASFYFKTGNKNAKAFKIIVNEFVELPLALSKAIYYTDYCMTRYRWYDTENLAGKCSCEITQVVINLK